MASDVRRGLCAVVMLLSCLTVLGGCGYAVNETFPDQYATVHVPIFENRTFYKGVEYDLSEALTKEVVRRTPYRIAKAGAADTSLTGTIVRITQARAARVDDVGLPEQMEFQIVVDFVWTDLRTGKVIKDRVGFAAVGRSIPTQPVGETQQTGQHGAVAQLAEDMVDQLRADW